MTDAQLDEETSEKLLDALRPDLARLMQIVGGDFDAWGLV